MFLIFSLRVLLKQAKLADLSTFNKPHDVWEY